jgi:predicted DNA-binding transcriptional regulator AlpA
MATKQKTSTAPGDRPMSERPLLVIEEVIELTRLSDKTLLREERAGRFPMRRKISAKRVAWSTAEVYAWLNKTWAAPAAEAA